MKFSCTQENLSKVLQMVSRISARGGNLPILANIYLTASGHQVIIKGTNLEVGIICNLRGDVENEGEFTVPARVLAEYINFLPKDTVHVDLKEDTLRIVCGTHQTGIKGLPASEFPLIPPVEQGETWEVLPRDLLEGLEQILLAISPTETRPEISGAHLKFEGQELTLAGTDSYRLAEKKIPVKGGRKPLQIIAPLRALQDLIRILSQTREDEGPLIKITASANQLAVILPTVQFVTRLIEGAYPDYKAIIPSTFAVKAAVPREEFIAALKAAGLFSKTGVYDVGVELNSKEGTLLIKALNSQIGEHQSVIKCPVQGPGNTKVAFNWKYLLDGIGAVNSETVILNTTDSVSPSMLTAENKQDYLYLVMPIKE